MELTPRLKKLKKRLFDVEFHQTKTWYFVNDTILTSEEIKAEPLVVRKGLMFQYVAKNLPAYIKPDELIVGNPNMCSVAFGSVVPRYATDEELAQAEKYRMDETSVNGHHPPDYEKIIRLGTNGVIEEIREAMDREQKKDNPDSEKMDEWRGMILSLEAIVIFARRHADAAIKAARDEKDPVRRAELYQISQVCRRVPEFPAETYQEAVQSYWFTYCMIQGGAAFVPLGCSDRYVMKYFLNDLKTGRITKEQAIDITGSWLIKCNERILFDIRKSENHHSFGMNAQGTLPKYQIEGSKSSGAAYGMYDTNMLMWDDSQDEDAECNFNFGQSGNDWLMNMVVGGVGRDGEDLTSELSFLIVDLYTELKLVMPTLAARVSKKSPEAFIRKCAEVLRNGQGEPMIYNDDAIIPGFVEAGVDIEDARTYSNDGCWETLIPGKSYFTYCHILDLKCLEWTLNHGVSAMSGTKDGIDVGDPEDFKDFEEFYQAFQEQVRTAIDRNCERRLDSYQLSSMIAPDPLQSAITDDCIARGRDITTDGTKYNFVLVLNTGLANLTDSLLVIKKLVYEEKVVTMAELKEALKADWKGYEQLRQRAVNSVPKFGNDEDEIDALAVRILKDFTDYVVTWREKQDTFNFICGCGTFENYAILGRDCAASPDGRFAREALAPNYSPKPGVDQEGPSAVLKSVTKPELLRLFGGCPTDLAILSNDFKGEVGTERLAGLIRSWCDMGGHILTVTGSSIEELEDAKVHPENHKDLRVRMGGLSAYFITMSPQQQDNIIKRFQK